MSSVFSITGGELHDPREPNEALIKSLENVLEMARSGELSGVAIVCAYFDKSVQRIRCGEYPVTTMVGAMQQLSFDILMDAAND